MLSYFVSRSFLPLHYAAFHLGHHCLQKYSFRGFPNKRINSLGHNSMCISLQQLQMWVSCLFDLILYVPVNNLSVVSGGVFLCFTSTRQELIVLLEDTRQ